jgi:hypothetical protein
MAHREQEPPPLGPGGAGWQALGAARERAVFALQRRLIWPLQDRTEALGARGRIGVFGGGGVAVAAVAAALVFGIPGGSGSGDGTTAVAVVQQPSTPKVAPTPAPQPKKTAPTKPSGPTLHGAPPDFAPAQNVKAGVGDSEALGGSRKEDSKPGGVPAERGASRTGDSGASGEGPSATASNDPAATAKIGATPGATAAAQADDLATGGRGANAAGDGTATGTTSGTGATTGDAAGTGTTSGSEAAAGIGGEAAGASAGVTGPPAPKAAKRTARRFAQAFVVYEVGGVDGKVRRAFGQTTTVQLSKSLLRRPPRQPANVKVPKAKVVNVVAGPSKGSVYTVSVSLLRVGVTSELRLQLEQGPGKKWQVTNVLG